MSSLAQDNIVMYSNCIPVCSRKVCNSDQKVYLLPPHKPSGMRDYFSAFKDATFDLLPGNQYRSLP